MLEHYLGKADHESAINKKLEKIGLLIEKMAAHQVEAQIVAIEIARETATPPVNSATISTGATASAEIDVNGFLVIKTNICTPKVAVYPRGKHKIHGTPVSNYSEVRNLWSGLIRKAMIGVPFVPLKKAAVLIMYHLNHKWFDPPNLENKVILDALISARVLADDSYMHVAIFTMGLYSPLPETEIHVADYSAKDILIKKMPSELPSIP